LNLEPWGSVFVIFRKTTAANSRIIPAKNKDDLTILDGPWTVAFQPGRGAPAAITLDKLSPWNENSEAGVKYFSGTGTYSKTIVAPKEWFKKGARFYLDLGSVSNLAEVELNGKPLGIVWHAPFRVDATDALEAGANELTIKVTNTWVNRIIGDQQPGVSQKITYTTSNPYHASSLLQQSGLVGPVTVEREQ
jgi:hypothetical protein